MRQHDLEIEMDATPEQVWEAVSTSQGIASWFAPIARVEPGKGGSVTMGWSPDMEATSRIEVWEPNQQIRIVGDRPEGTPPSVVDYYIEGRGGKTVLRLVHSGFGDTANFDGEFESTGGAWPTFLKMMKHSVEQGVARCRNVNAVPDAARLARGGLGEVDDRHPGVAENRTRLLRRGVSGTQPCADVRVLRKLWWQVDVDPDLAVVRRVGARSGRGPRALDWRSRWHVRPMSRNRKGGSSGPIRALLGRRMGCFF
jgi:uncharacterized protein YndB with AHSA1/START domain